MHESKPRPGIVFFIFFLHVSRPIDDDYTYGYHQVLTFKEMIALPKLVTFRKSAVWIYFQGKKSQTGKKTTSVLKWKIASSS